MLIVKAKRTHQKYKNIKVILDGITFDSKKEAARYGQLKLMLAAGVIEDLRLQVPYKIAFNGQKICTYKPDFVYFEIKNGERREVVEDVKGMKTPVYNLKKKMMLACFGIVIKEV